jgi:hypothetical protein
VLLTSELYDLQDYLVDTEAFTLISYKIENTDISICFLISIYSKSFTFLVEVEQLRKHHFELGIGFTIYDRVGVELVK